MSETPHREATRIAALKPNGPAAAAILAAGIGSFVLGLLTAGAEAIPALKTALTWSAPVGPLSGKTGVAVIAYLVSWLILAILWRGQGIRFEKVYTATLILLALGLLGTFPVFYEALAVKP
ncbi:MAG: hypothetical protein HYY04_15705 [Chloroflexi bacterium]|nr:hypothetical protein [Chloroflexota bacterium]